MALRGTSPPVVAVDIDIVQSLGALPELRRHLHHHMVLIERRVHRRYLALPKGVVQSVIDQLRRDSHPRGGLAVIIERGLQAAVLLVGATSVSSGSFCICWSSTGPPLVQISKVVALNRVLVFGCSEPAAATEILHRLQEQRRPGDGQLGPQTVDHLAGAELALFERLQDMNTRRVNVCPLQLPVKTITLSTAGSDLIMFHEAGESIAFMA